MKIISLFFAILLLLAFVNLQNLCQTLEFTSKQLQLLCVNQFSPHQESRNLSAAFVCGSELVDFKQQQIFQATGLIHLIVVSGSHLNMISLVLVNFLLLIGIKKKFHSAILLSLLFGYCLLTGFQAPSVRALCLIMITLSIQPLRLSWNSNLTTLFSGIFLLVIFPDWIFNFSFFLSWLASLGFCFSLRTGKTFRDRIINFLFCCFLIQFFIAIILNNFSLLSLLANLAIAPVLALFLWPLSLASLLTEKLIPVCDYVWSSLLKALHYLTAFGSSTPPLDFANFNWLLAWLYIALIHTALYYLHLKRRPTCA